MKVMCSLAWERDDGSLGGDGAEDVREGHKKVSVDRVLTLDIFIHSFNKHSLPVFSKLGALLGGGH